MHGSLCLNMAHDLASLFEVKFGPILHVHSQDVSLAKIGLGSRDKFKVSFREERRRRRVFFGKLCFELFEGGLQGFLFFGGFLG